ncbi:phage neck terminator protein [Secundilactobacillus muriivasis]
MYPFDEDPTQVEKHLGTLIKVVEQITGMSVVPNERIAQTKTLPFVTYYPIVIDDPVLGDATLNDGLFETTVSLDVFAKTMLEATRSCGKLRIYLADRYTRQSMRRDGGFTIQQVTTPNTRSITNLPISAVHHVGFDVTFQYYRHYQSPIDQISAITDISIDTKEDE